MPKFDQDAQDAYAELRKRGLFKKDPDAAAAAQELVKRGVLQDLSGGTNYSKPTPQASAPSVSQYSLPAAGTPPPPPTPQVRRPGVTFRQPELRSSSQPELRSSPQPSPKAASLYQGIKSKGARQGDVREADRKDEAFVKSLSSMKGQSPSQIRAQDPNAPRFSNKAMGQDFRDMVGAEAESLFMIPEAVGRRMAGDNKGAAKSVRQGLKASGESLTGRAIGGALGGTIEQGEGGAASRSFAQGVVPGAGGLAGFSGGARAGASLPIANPLLKGAASLGLGMLGAAGGGAVAAGLQRGATGLLLGSDGLREIDQQGAIDQQNNKMAATLGQAGTALLFGKPTADDVRAIPQILGMVRSGVPLRMALSSPAGQMLSEGLRERAMEAGVEVLAAAGESYAPLLVGGTVKPMNTADVVIQALSGAALPGENRLGRVFTGGGQRGAEALITGAGNVQAGAQQFIAGARDSMGLNAQQDALAKSVMDAQARNAFTPLREATRAGKAPAVAKPAAVAPPVAPVATPNPKAAPRPTSSGLTYDSLTSQPGPSLPDSKATMPQYQEAGAGAMRPASRTGKPEADVLKNQPTAQTREEQIDKQSDPTFDEYVGRLVNKGMEGIAAGQPRRATAYFEDGYEYEISDAGKNGTWRATRTSNKESGANTPDLKPAPIKSFPSASDALEWLVKNRKPEYYQDYLDRVKPELNKEQKAPETLTAPPATNDAVNTAPVNKTADSLTRPAEPVKEIAKSEPVAEVPDNYRKLQGASKPGEYPDTYTPEVVKAFKEWVNRPEYKDGDMSGASLTEAQRREKSEALKKLPVGTRAVAFYFSKADQFGDTDIIPVTGTLDRVAEESGKGSPHQKTHYTVSVRKDGGGMETYRSDLIVPLETPSVNAETPAATVKPTLTMSIKKGTHTKKGHDIWTVRMAERVERGEYDNLNAAAKALGGYYSAFGAMADRGFIFKDEASAKKFKAEQEGGSAPVAEAKPAATETTSTARPSAYDSAITTYRYEPLGALKKMVRQFDRLGTPSDDPIRRALMDAITEKEAEEATPISAVETEVRKDPAASKAMDEGRIVVASVPKAEEISEEEQIATLEKHASNYFPQMVKIVRRDGQVLLRLKNPKTTEAPRYVKALPNGKVADAKITDEATEEPIKPEAKADPIKIGKNKFGDDVFLDERGVRKYLRNGVMHEQTVQLGPRGEFIGVNERSRDADEFQVAKYDNTSSPTTKEPVFSGNLPEGYTAVYQGDTATGLPYFALYQRDRRIKGNYTESELPTALRVDMEKQGITTPVEAAADAFSPEVLKTKSGEDLAKMKEKLSQLRKVMPNSDVLVKQIGRITQEQTRRGTEPSADDPSEEWHVAKNGDIYKTTKERGLYSLVKMPVTASGKIGTPQILSTQTKSIIPMREAIQGLAGSETSTFPDRAGAIARRAEIRASNQNAVAKSDPAATSQPQKNAGSDALEKVAASMSISVGDAPDGLKFYEDMPKSLPASSVIHVARNSDGGIEGAFVMPHMDSDSSMKAVALTAKDYAEEVTESIGRTARAEMGSGPSIERANMPTLTYSGIQSITVATDAQGNISHAISPNGKQIAPIGTPEARAIAGDMEAFREVMAKKATSQTTGTLKTQESSTQTEGQPNGSEDTRRREADSRADSPVADDSAGDIAPQPPRERKPQDVSRPDSQGNSEEVSAQQGNEDKPAATSASGGGRNPRRSAGDAPAADVPLEKVEQEAAPAYVAPEMAKDVETGNLSDEDEPSRPNFFRTAAELAEALADGRKLLKLVKAVEALKEVERQGRTATPEEQKVLADFPGWGWTGNLLSAKNTAKGRYARTPEEKAYERLTGLLDKEEFRAALQATQYSHFTAPEVIVSMWDALRRMGYTGGGSALEPSMGNGLFFQLMPEDMRTKTRLVGVEKDSLTGRIAAQLFQGGKIFAGKGFEEVQKAIGDNSQDIILSNVPFGNLRIFDPEGEKKWGNTLLTGRIHNWFFAKSLEKVKPGGIIAFITSNGTLDANDAIAQETRAHLARGADFLGAIRLPNTAFQKNAGTEVTTDIIFLRKKGEGLPEVEANIFQKTAETEGKDGQIVRVNEYFVSNPDMVLGTHSLEGTMRHGGGNEYALLSDGRDIGIALAEATLKLPSGVFAPQKVAASSVKTSSTAQTTLRRGALTVEGGKLYVSTPVGDEVVLEEADPLSPETMPVVEKYVGLRDTLRDLINAQLSPDSTDRQKNDLRKKLKASYDAFVKAHGPLHKGKAAGKPAIADHFITDPNAYDVLSLEKWDRKTRKVTGLSDIFSKDVIAPNKVATAANDPKDALGIVLRQGGRVDIEAMLQLLREGGAETTEDALYDQLNKQDLLFKTPQGSYETAEQYGSGNVREKLEDAKRATIGDEAFGSNVKFLDGVQPANKGAADIVVGLGASWVPTSILGDFLSHLGVRGTVNYSSVVGKFDVTASGFSDAIKASSTFGTNRINAAQLLNHALRGTIPKIEDYDRERRSVVNVEATEAAGDKLAEIREEWSRWVYQDASRANELVDIYNEKVNVFKTRKYDGSSLSFPGQNPLAFPKGLRAHQKNAVWRIIQDRFVLLAHEVGTGKTATMITAAMELRRMGLRQKPLIVVKKPTIGQFAETFKRMYPAARILVADSRNFSAENRKEFMAQIATGDWDAVIVWHNAFEKLSVSPETASQFYNEQIENLEAFVAEQQKADSKSFTAKQAGKKIETLKAKLSKLQLQIGERQDDSTYWDDLGVDQIFIDESQTYKNLAVESEIEGMGNEGNQITFDMLMKIRSLQSRGGGAVFASGTPLTNSIAEIHSLAKYMRPDLLRSQGQFNFDDWARTYGSLATSFEQDVAGRYKNKQRFNKFTNVQELMALYRSFADTVFADDIPGLVRPKLVDRDGKVTNAPIVIETLPDDQQKSFFQRMLARADSIPSMFKAMEIKAAGGTPDTMLKISTEGRQVSLDPRLVMPGAKDSPNSKINKVVKEVLALHKNKKHEANQRTQLVFLDQGVPGEKGEWNLYQDITDKLVKGGVDRKEIAWVSDAKTDEAREALFERVSDGSLRILLGSREKMGVGVNVQERLIAIHQVDPTWRPDQMEQADGRIIRQGNLFAEDGVHIFQYVNKGSFDGFMWKKVAAKLGFINQLLRGDVTTNEVEDLSGEDTFSLEQMFAVATGDERVERYIQLGEEVRRLSKAQRYHLGVRADLLRRAVSMDRELPGLRKTLEGLKSVVEWRGQVPSPEVGDSSQARMDSFARYYLDPTDYEKQWYKDAMEKWEKKKEKFYTVKKNADLPFEEPQPASPKIFTQGTGGYNFTPKDYGIALWRVAMRTEGKGEGGYWRGARVQIFSDKSERIVTFEITPPGAPHSLTVHAKLSPSGASQYGTVLDSRLNDVDNDIKGYEYRIANNEDQIPKAKEQAEKPFAKADELEAKTKELADLTEELGPLLKKGSKRGWGGVVKEEAAPEPDMEEVGGDSLASPALAPGEREPSSLHMPATADFGGQELGAMIAPASARVKIAPIKWDRKPLTDPGKLIDALALATGRAVLVAKQKKGLAGSYRPSDARTSIKWFGDMETSAHEIGHAMDDSFGIVAAYSGKRQKSPWDTELFQQELQATAKTSMTLKLRRAEAVAEWFRAYAMNPAEAERLAPTFTAHVKATVPLHVLKAFEDFGTGARRLAGAPATEAAMTHIQWGEGDQRSIREKLTETLGEAKDSVAGQQAPDIFKLTFADKLTANFQDALRPVVAAADWARKLTGASHLLPEKDPILLMRLHADTVGKVGQMLDTGFVSAKGQPIIDPDTGEPIGGLSWLLAPISRPSVAETEHLMKLAATQGVAERTLEKGQQLGRDTVLTGIGMGLWSDASTARAILAEHDQLDQETKDSIAEALRRYRLVANSLLDYMVDSGRLSAEGAQVIKNANAQYIALQRAMEDAPPFEGSGKSRRLATVAAPVKKMDGSMRQLRDPFVSLLDQTYKIVAESDRNRAMDSFVDLFRSQRAIYAGGVVPLSQVAAQTTTPTDGKNIKVFHNGEAQHWEINDPQVYAALKGLGSPAAPTGPLRILAKISAGIPRALITGNPAFAIRNFSRDMPERWMKDALGSKPWDSFKKFSDEEKERHALSGGTGMGHYAASRVEYAKAIKAVVKAESKKGTIVRLPSSGALESYHKLLQSAEVQGRLPAYRAAFTHAKDKLGYDDYNAGLFAAGKARELMDFAVAGNYLRALSPYIPFVNASAQGFAANYKALRRDPAKYLTKFLLLAAAKSLALAIMGMLGKSGADKLEEYRSLPAYQRDLCINLPLPWADGWLAIPVGFEAASAAGAIERGLDYAMGNKDAYLGYFTTPTATQDDNFLMQVFHGSLVQSMLPIKPDDLLSLGGLPGAMNEMKTNHDAFRQRNIVPPYETSLPLAERKGASSASRAGKALAAILKTDPRAVDHLIGSTAGGTGRIVTTLSDLGREDKPLTGNRVLNMATGIVKEGPGYGSPQVQRTMTQLRENRTTPPLVLDRAQDNLKEAKTSPQLEIAKRELRKAASGPMPPAAIKLTTAKRSFADSRIEAIKQDRAKAGLPPLTADQEERIRRAIASKLGQRTRPLRRDEEGVKTENAADRIRSLAPPGLSKMGR